MIACVLFDISSPKVIARLFASLLPVSLSLLISKNQLAKEILLSSRFGGMTYNTFHSHCNTFATSVIPKIIRYKANACINNLLNRNFHVYIVTASLEEWVKPWAKTMEIEVIGSKPEICNGIITGKLSGKNCTGWEKVRRIRETIPDIDFRQIYTYGDTKADIPMLSMASFGNLYYKPFR